MKRIVWLLMMSLVSMLCPFLRAAVYTVNYVRQPSEDSPKRLHAHVAGTGRPAAQLTKATLRTFRIASGESPEIPAGLSVGDELDLDLFSDVRYSVTLIARMKGKSDARMSFLASTDGRDGVCNAVVVWTEAGLQIDVRDYDKRRGYSVFTTADGVIVREIDPSKAGGRHLPSPEIETTGDEQDVETTASVKSLTLSRDVFVDILVAYDIGAAQWAVANGGGLENFAEMAVQRMNKALLNSKIYSSQFSFRLAGTYEVGASAEGDLKGALHAAQSGNRSWRGGDWSGVRLKREKVGADIVVTLIDGTVGRSATAESDTVGIGFALEANSGSFAGLAYSCCAIDCVADDHTMTHEVGHNMGAGHSDVQRLDPGPQYHSYSSGYYLNANGVDCHTIMAYDDDGYSSAEYREIEYFSTPNATYYGVPVGDATHNNALTLMNTCQMVSRFRTAKEAEDPDEPPEEATPEPAGEFFDLAWTTSSDHPWTYGRLANGSFAARSADFRNGTSTPSTGVSWLETTLAGPKVITFSYDTYFYTGPFLVSVDGAVVRSITGGEQWESVEVPEGTHTVRFAFECYDWYCSSDTFNGVWLYDLRVCEKSLVPIIVPDSTSEPETATRFTGELTVLITNSVPDSTIYYSTNHYGDAMLDAQVYTGPLTISKSAVVRAFAKARDGTTSGLTESVFIERHAVQPGEWTADAEGVLAAAKTDGNLIVTVATFSKDGKTSGFGDLVEIAESSAFCSWARENKVFLLACDMTQSQGGYHRGEGARCDIGWGRYVEYLSAYRYFGSLASNTDLTTTRLVVSRAWDPSRCVGEMVGRSGSYLGGTQYRGTVDSLIACLGSILAPRPSKSVTVTFEAGEGTVSPKTLTRQSGQPFGTLPVPTRKNYVFMGWKCKVPSSDEDGYAFYHYFGGAAVLPEDIVPYEDVTLVAQWEDRRVYVYFMRQYAPNGAYYWQYGNYYQRGCAYGELPEDDPTMTGYAFLGWYSEKEWGERIAETSIVPDQTTPVTNYAHWIANEYKVRYNANDTDEFPAEGEMRVQTFRYDLAEELRPNAFVREGYDFQGWTTHPDWTYVYYKDAQLISNLTSKADETVDLYAVWKARQVTITFDMNDFPNFQDTEKQLTVGSPFSWQIPSVYSTRYVVDGFYTARKGGVELLATTSVPACDTTYYLQWHKKHYSVAFNANGGSGAMAPQDFVYGESQRLSENAFAKAGSLFSGWATSPDGEVRYADRQRVNDLEATEGGTFQLYAKWEPTVELDPAPVADGGPYRQTVGKYTWTFRVSDGRVSICNDNESAYQCAVSPSPTGSVDVPDVLGGRPVVDVSAHAFRSCDNVERIVLPPSVEQIGSYAFIGCSSLTNVVFGPNVKSIGWGAFWNCGSLDGVRIPASVVSIGDAAFSLCDSLVDLTVETENRNYCMIDGALYTKDAGELLRCSPMINTCVVPKSVRRVGNSCFAPIVWGMSPKGVMLENVYFMGNAPEGNPFNGAPAELTCYAREGSCGWIDSQTTALPETWPSSNGRRIVRWEDEPPMTYAVTFDLGEHGTRTGGGELEQTVVGGAAATVPTVAVASGYELVGWDPAPDCVTADMTVRAFYRHTEAFAPGHYTVSTNGYAWSFTVTDRGAKIERGNEEKQRAVEPTPVGAVEIPSELGGWPVTAIGCYAFYYCDQMTSVTIPSSVTNIADYAFTYCKGLRSVTIPSSVTAIGYSFGGCKALQALAFNGNEPLYLGKGATFAPRSTVVLVREDSQGWRDGSDFIEIWPRNFGPTCPVRLWNGTMAEGDIVYELGRDGKNAADNPHFYIDALLPRKLSAPTREGYAFNGWTLDGREVTEIPVGTTGDVVLTAQWEEVPTEPGWGWSDGTRQWRYVTVEYNDNGTTKTGAKISNDGECAVSPRPQGVLTVPPAIDGYPVVEVEEFAFADCIGLTSVVLPSCFIGNDLKAKAFAGCDDLTSVSVDQGGSDELYNVKDGLLLYRDDWLVLCPPGLADPVIPETVRTLEWAAFYENRKMARIVIPDGISTISGECFMGCENLSEIVCRSTLTSFKGNPFEGTAWEAAQGDFVVMNGVLLDYHGAGGNLAVPEDVRVVNAEAFRGRRDVVSVDLPPSVEQIGDFAFYYCSALTRVTGGDGLVGVGPSVMKGTALWETVPEGLVTICDWVVGYKGEVPEELVIPADVRGIADSVFSGCANLKTVIYMGDPAGVLIGSGAFYKTPYEMAKYPFLDSPVEANAQALATGKLLFVLSGADWCPWTTVVKKYLRKLGDSFFNRFVVYYCNIDTDTYNMARGAPSYGVFDPVKFKVNWNDGRLSYDSGGVEERVQKVIDDALAAYNPPLPAAYDLSLSLSGAGWHEVSFSVLPEGGKPEEVFAPVADKIGYVTYGSQNWNPLTGGTLTAFEIGKGYWVQTKAENVAWTVTGQGNPDVEIALKAGWNLIGYPLLAEGEIETVLATALATGNIRYIYSGSRVYPGALTTMTPGKGYWIYAETAETIRFDVK